MARRLLAMVMIGVALCSVLVGSLPGSLNARAQEQSLAALLPAASDISADLAQTEDRSRTLAEQAGMFANAGEMAQRLADWGWQENVFRVYQSTIPAPNGAPSATIDVSLTRFASADGAAAALPVFLQDRAAVLGEDEAQRPLQLGDETRALRGATPQGDDVTLYVRQGNLLLRVSVTTVAGTPIAPERIAQGILIGVGASAPETAQETAQPQVVAGGPLASYLLTTLPIPNEACFSVAGEGGLDLAALQGRYGGVQDLQDQLQRLGWQGGDYRQFGCDNPPGGNAGWIDMTVQQFATPDDANVAVFYFADARARSTSLQSASAPELGAATAALSGPGVNGEDYTLYFSSGSYLFSVTGVAPNGDPRADVGDIANALYERSLGAPATAEEPSDIVTPVPTVPVIVQETPSVAAPPTIAPPATSTPVPPIATFAPTPVPTLAPPPATAVPTTIPVVIPTTAPPPPTAAPTATAPPPTTTPNTSVDPTPTPRVIRPPTPVGEGS